jgi:hypothetical protein
MSAHIPRPNIAPVAYGLLPCHLSPHPPNPIYRPVVLWMVTSICTITDGVASGSLHTLSLPLTGCILAPEIQLQRYGGLVSFAHPEGLTGSGSLLPRPNNIFQECSLAGIHSPNNRLEDPLINGSQPKQL